MPGAPNGGAVAGAQDADYDARRVCGASRGERVVSPPTSGEDSTQQVQQVVYAVRRRIGDFHRALPEEFRPAHLSVALVDAVFNPRLHYASVVVPIVERYCSHFGLVRTVAPGEWPPPLSAQQTLCDLIAAFDAFGGEFLRKEVFRSGHRSPGTQVYKADNVLCCARALRVIGLNTLQDVQGKEPGRVKRALCDVHGIGKATAHMLLMYCGNDDYVKGDVHVCRFVADALGEDDVAPREAERLVAREARGAGPLRRCRESPMRALGGSR